MVLFGRTLRFFSNSFAQSFNIAGFVVVGMALSASLFPAFAQTDAKLGIALKQGYNSPYISEINPYGSGAASGFMSSDYILEINMVPIWFTHQAEKFLKFNIQKGQPFYVMVKRNGSLHRIEVDPTKPSRLFPKRQGTDIYSKCFMAPTAECIKVFITKPVDGENSSKVYGYSGAIDDLTDLGDFATAKQFLTEMEALVLNDAKLVKQNTGTLFRAMDKLGIKPSKKHYDAAFRYTDKTKVNDLLNMVKLFAEHDMPQYAEPFYREALKHFEKKPSDIKYKAGSLGTAIAALEKFDDLRSYLESESLLAESKNRILKEVILYFVKKDDKTNADKALGFIDIARKSWTNKDQEVYVRLFNKLHRDGLAMHIIKAQESAYEKGKGQLFIQPIIGASLVRTWGAIGSFHNAQKYLGLSSEKSRLSLMIDLTEQAAESRGAAGLSVQFYKDFPKFLQDTQAALKAATPEQRKRISAFEITKFYQVLAAHLPANPSPSDLRGYKLESYDHDRIINAFIEVRKHSKALEWAESTGARSYAYSKIFESLGSSAKSQADIDTLTRRAAFEPNKLLFNRAYIKRLYWNGYFDKALAQFNKLDIKEKKIMIRRQLPFVVACKTCHL